MNSNVSRPAYIFWDWNGTLLNDIQACIASMNTMLKKRNMPYLTEKRYKEIFTFPVQNYYKALGFDFSVDTFEKLSEEFISGYHLNKPVIKLTDKAEETLKAFQSKGIKQVIISAMKQDMLTRQVHDYGVSSYFEEVLGIDHIYADSKVYIAEKFIAKEKLHPSEVVFIGDTLHDYEVAESLGIRTVLVSSGHQHANRFSTLNARISENLNDLLMLVL